MFDQSERKARSQAKNAMRDPPAETVNEGL